MTLMDPLADALSTIKNAEDNGYPECTIAPASNVIGNLLKVMLDNEYISGFEFMDNGSSGLFKVELNGMINKCGVIKPRFSLKKNEFEFWEKRFLPASDFGLLIITTPLGILSHREAKEQGVGGRLIAFVY